MSNMERFGNFYYVYSTFSRTIQLFSCGCSFNSKFVYFYARESLIVEATVGDSSLPDTCTRILSECESSGSLYMTYNVGCLATYIVCHVTTQSVISMEYEDVHVR